MFDSEYKSDNSFLLNILFKINSITLFLHLGGESMPSYVARTVDCAADLRALCHLPCGFRGGRSGLQPGMVHSGDS